MYEKLVPRVYEGGDRKCILCCSWNYDCNQCLHLLQIFRIPSWELTIMLGFKLLSASTTTKTFENFCKLKRWICIFWYIHSYLYWHRYLQPRCTVKHNAEYSKIKYLYTDNLMFPILDVTGEWIHG